MPFPTFYQKQFPAILATTPLSSSYLYSFLYVLTPLPFLMNGVSHVVPIQFMTATTLLIVWKRWYLPIACCGYQIGRSKDDILFISEASSYLSSSFYISYYPKF
jgi:hypothetical protein